MPTRTVSAPLRSTHSCSDVYLTVSGATEVPPFTRVRQIDASVGQRNLRPQADADTRACTAQWVGGFRTRSYSGHVARNRPETGTASPTTRKAHHPRL